ncbi:unnamed protein product [Arctogadus glacialis]
MVKRPLPPPEYKPGLDPSTVDLSWVWTRAPHLVWTIDCGPGLRPGSSGDLSWVWTRAPPPPGLDHRLGTGSRLQRSERTSSSRTAAAAFAGDRDVPTTPDGGETSSRVAAINHTLARAPETIANQDAAFVRRPTLVPGRGWTMGER